MSSYPPFYAYPSAPPVVRAVPDPPRLHWGWVLVLSLVTFGVFGTAWLIVASELGAEGSRAQQDAAMGYRLRQHLAGVIPLCHRYGCSRSHASPTGCSGDHRVCCSVGAHCNVSVLDINGLHAWERAQRRPDRDSVKQCLDLFLRPGVLPISPVPLRSVGRSASVPWTASHRSGSIATKSDLRILSFGNQRRYIPRRRCSRLGRSILAGALGL